MKKLAHICFYIFLCIGCEDVIEVDTPAETPRLIVDALVLVDTSQTTVNIKIKASVTSDFFGKSEPAVLDGLCLRKEKFGACIFPMETVKGSGIYEAVTSPSAFTEDIDDQRWLLSFRHDGEIYLGFADYVPTVQIDTIYQGNGTFFSDDEKEVVISLTDNPERSDFYLFDFDFFNEYLVTEDEFYQGQSFQFSYFYENGPEIGQDLNIRIIGVDEPFFNYMDQLIVQSEGSQGPFQTPVATVRGNYINVTEIDNIDFFDNVDQTNNYALGYFAICQTFSKSIVVQ